MAVNWKGIAAEIARRAISGGMGGGNALVRAGSSLANIGGLPVPGSAGVLSGIVGGAPLGSVGALAAKGYPTEFAPRAWHYYEVVNVPGKPNFNRNGKANAAAIDSAGIMQTLDDHNRAIVQFVRPGMDKKTERAALSAGMDAEKALPAFWNESESRRPFTVSSSAITGIRLTPDARIEVQWKSSPKWYTFRAYDNTHEASKAAQQLLKADSIGRAVMPFQRNGKPIEYKSPDISWWNRINYDGAFA